MSLRSRLSIGAIAGWTVVTAAPSLPAQLAITEVMSSAADTLGTNPVPQRADFWELTNFGADAVDLTGCRFSDEAGLSDEYLGEDEAMFGGRRIAPGESVIFFQETRDVCANEAQFREWWGEHNLPAGLQIQMYTGRGFNKSSDAVQLWKVTATSTTLVDRVQLHEARRGFTFTYDPTTGVLDSVSALDAGDAFKAVTTDDVGSPGFTTGAAPLAITRQPRDLTVDSGTPATLSIRTSGLPKARFQWRRDGVPIPGATANTLLIPAAEPSAAGSYTVEVENGLTSLLSGTAVLHVNTVPIPPRIVVPPVDLVVTPGQTAVFSVSARGYPLPTFQWQFEGGDIPGATAATLEVPNVNFNSAGIYSVRLQNPLGSTNAAAVLMVRPKPNLKVTEMMGSRSTNSTVTGRGDWWELTNFDTDSVNLRGYRFDDFPGVLEGAVVITNNLILQPGESALFIQDMTPEAFKLWWGEENLPEDVQFVRYTGNGISAGGDSITLWNTTAREPGDYIVKGEYLHLNDDFTPVRGISRTFWCGDWIWEGVSSALGACGAVQAVASDDIASPGYVANHPSRPRAMGVSRDAHGVVHVTWKTEAGQRYELLRKESLSAPEWVSLGQQVAEGGQLTVTDTAPTDAAQRFYRLRLLPELP